MYLEFKKIKENELILNDNNIGIHKKEIFFLEILYYFYRREVYYTPALAF